MDFFIFAISAAFIAIGSAAPVDNETQLVMFEEIQDLKNNLTQVWNVLEDYKDRLEDLERQDAIQGCNESAIQEFVEFEIKGVIRRPVKDRDEDDYDDDDEEEDNDRRRMRSRGKEETESYPAPGERCQNLRQGYNNGPMPSHQAKPANISAFCSVRPNKALPPAQRPDVRGKVHFVQNGSDKLTITVKVSGLPSSQDKPGLATEAPPGVNVTSKHGFHVHELGNLTNGCESAGSHYNPFNNTHGGPQSPQRHLGDFGNIESDGHGNVAVTMEFEIKDALTGPHSFIGRALVIHAKEDDLGSNPNDNGSITTGNSGQRLACCIIHKLN